MAVDRGSHTVVVVFDAKDHGQIPKVRHVGRLPDLSLVGGTVTVAGDRALHVLAGLGIVLVGKGQTGSDRYLGTDDTVATEKVVFLAVHVHGTTLSLGDAVGLSEELSDDAGDRSSPHQGQDVAAVGGHPGVLLVEGALDAGGDGLLSVVQVAKSADVSGLVFVVAGDFHPAHRVHRFERLDELFLGNLGRFGRAGFEIVGLEGSGNIKGVRGRHSTAGSRSDRSSEHGGASSRKHCR
mmetsp:Transcript_12019/g.25419  ORF Transcript_12019/g.25419 Transcript_12019/m.25419 type:complete len:238 (+) Transcript_12019:628-1341(+)